MRAAIWKPGKRGIRLRKIAPPSHPGPGEVLLEPLAVGLCGTDREIVRGAHPVTQERVERGGLEHLVLGHEWSARVVEVGNGVKGFAADDLVVGEVGVFCNGAREEIGISRDGALAEKLLVPVEILHKIPAQGLSAEAAALIEPMSVALRAVMNLTGGDFKRASLEGALEGKKVLVWGDGPIAVLIGQILRLTKADFLGLVGISPFKLQKAQNLKIPNTFSGAPPPGMSPDVIFEASGAKRAFGSCLSTVADRGQVVVVGFPGTIGVDVSSIALRELTVIGSRSGDDCWELAIELASGGQVDLEGMITSRHGLKKVKKAFRRIGAKDNLKTVIRVG